jgi:hypothetical protein
VVAFALFAFARGAATASDAGPKSPEQLVNDVRKKLSQGRISRIEVYYFDWSATTYASMSEEDLLRMYDYKITIANPRQRAVVLEEALGRSKFRRVLRGVKKEQFAPELRIGCVFYSGDTKELSFFFSAHGPITLINGTLFERDPELLYAITTFLPHEAYERMYRDILYLCTYRARQQLTLGEEREHREDEDSQPLLREGGRD